MTYDAQDYIKARQKYSSGRPQAMIWSDTDTLFTSDTDYEIGANTASTPTFLILSDHNRSEIDVTSDRIEKRDRMVNGRMRSFHIADKQKISLSWDMIPSRRFTYYPGFAIEDGLDRKLGDPVMGQTIDSKFYANTEYTVDGGAGGADLKDWYDTHYGPFWVYLSYDKLGNKATPQTQTDSLKNFLEPIEMYFADFSYTVVKRGQTNIDMWNVSITLEEV